MVLSFETYDELLAALRNAQSFPQIARGDVPASNKEKLRQEGFVVYSEVWLERFPPIYQCKIDKLGSCKSKQK